MTNSMNITLPNDTLEGTVASLSTWLVKEGESVQQGDPILELETDKVTMEICAEASGVIAKILIAPGDSVGEDTVFGYLDCRRQEGRENNDQVISESAIEVENCSDAISQRHLIGPAVRKLLREYDVNIEGIAGTGRGGRVTRNDITAFIHDHQALKSNNVAPVQRPVNIATVSEPVIKTGALNGKSIPHTSMRKSIANHMVESLLHTSPHVTSVFEMDMGRVIEHRKMCKMGFAEAGVKLTFTAYFLAAAAQAIRKVPLVNSRFYDDHLEVFDDINIGVGTALGDDGLVVPVIKQVQEKNLFGIATVLEQQTEKARNGKLTMSEMSDGTFTISNHGVGGSLFATPIIINQPQVAILGIGKLEKRVVVEEVNGEDVMVIRPKCYVSLSIDHRALDAYQTNLFLSHFVEVIENWGE